MKTEVSTVIVLNVMFILGSLVLDLVTQRLVEMNNIVLPHLSA
jgi:hypothetical protein